MKPECGYLYIAAGKKHIEEASVSARSLRRVDKNVHITLITNKLVKNDLFDNIQIYPFDVSGLEEGFAYKVKHIYSDSPYEKTFFIDTDTYFYDSCSMLFKLLDYFDILMALDPADTHCARVNGKPLTGCTPYNTGVMIYKKNAKNEAVFKKWQQIYEEKLRAGSLGRESDQTAFVETLLTLDTKVYVLPYMFHARSSSYLTLVGSVKLVHGRSKNYGALGKKINSSLAERAWDPIKRRCVVRGKGNAFLNKTKIIQKKSLRSLKKFISVNFGRRF